MNEISTYSHQLSRAKDKILTSLGDPLSRNDRLRAKLDRQELGLVLAQLYGRLDAPDIRHDDNGTKYAGSPFLGVLDLAAR